MFGTLKIDPLWCPLRPNLSRTHLPYFLSSLHFVSAGLGGKKILSRARANHSQGKKGRLRGFRGKKREVWRPPGGPWDTPPPHPHYWQKCSRNIHESSGGSEQNKHLRLCRERKDRGDEKLPEWEKVIYKSLLGGGSRFTRQLPICFPDVFAL